MTCAASVVQLVGAGPVEEEAVLEGSPQSTVVSSGECECWQHWLGPDEVLAGEEAQIGNASLMGMMAK